MTRPEDMNEPEELARVANESRGIQARYAKLMLKHPSARWLLGPIYRLLKWAERQAETALREDGWK